MNKIIEATQLCKRFDAIEPVKQVDFTINRGEFVTLFGPSGSGKSTLLSLVAGLDHATDGKVVLDGHDLSRLSEDELALLRRDHVGFVFQSFHLIPTLSALENIAFPLYPVKMAVSEKRDRARELLAQFDLADRGDHLPSHLSGGERQRVAIARALVNRPGIIFCDEPTGNLDSTTGKEILDLLLKLNTDKNVTLFMVTHDTTIAKLSHRSLYMKDGEVS
jgi:putative ABC transport system ATP-binding protein